MMSTPHPSTQEYYRLMAQRVKRWTIVTDAPPSRGPGRPSVWTGLCEAVLSLPPDAAVRVDVDQAKNIPRVRESLRSHLKFNGVPNHTTIDEQGLCIWIYLNRERADAGYKFGIEGNEEFHKWNGP